MTRRATPVVLAVTLLAAVSATGCGHSSRTPDLGSVGRLPDRAAGLRTLGWGVAAGRVSVVVRNDGAQIVRSARAVITARDAHGNAVATTSGPLECCGISRLAPGATSGLYADLGVGVRRITAVTVRYAEIALADPGASADTALPTVADVGVQTGGATTDVTARLTVAGGPATGGPVRAQALLTNAGGRIVAVLSRRVACLGPGRPQVVRMSLSGSVPPGTLVSSVTAAPVAGRAC
jgi:hypothetical protein